MIPKIHFAFLRLKKKIAPINNTTAKIMYINFLKIEGVLVVVVVTGFNMFPIFPVIVVNALVVGVTALTTVLPEEAKILTVPK